MGSVSISNPMAKGFRFLAENNVLGPAETRSSAASDCDSPGYSEVEFK
jgi:hypothetical protein